MRLSRYRLLSVTLLFYTLLLGCAATEDAAHRERLERARAALNAKRYHAVLTLLSEIETEAAPWPDKEYYLMQGLASFKLGEHRHAIDALEKAQPDSLQLQTYMAYLYLLQGDSQRPRAIAAALERQHNPHPEISILKGNISLKEHAYDEAEQHFRSATILDGSSTKAYTGLANIYLLQRNFIKAEENYFKAVILSGGDTSAYIALLNYFIAAGKYDAAQYTANIALSRYPNDINLYIIQNNLYIKIGKPSEGLQTLEKSYELFRNSTNIKIKLIRNYFILDRLDDAHRLIQMLFTGGHDNYYGLILLGEYHLRKNEVETAYYYFEKANLINSNSALVNYYLGLIHLIKNNHLLTIKFLKKSIENSPGFIHSYLLLATVYMYQKKYVLVSRYANLVLHIDPGNAFAHLINGVSLFLLNLLNEAQYEMDIADYFEKDNQTIQVIRILIMLETNNFDGLEDTLSRINDSNVKKLFLHLEILRETKNVTDWKKILEIYEKNSQNYFSSILLAKFYRDNNDFDRAKEYFLKAKAANKGIAIPYYGLAELESREGKQVAAIVYLQQAIERKPDFVKSYQALGSLYEQIKDYHSAKMTYEKGLLYAPEDRALLNNLAWVNLVHLGDQGAAYIGIRKALSLAPEDPDIQDTLAWWYFLNDDYHHALALLKKVVEVHPAHPLYRYHLGMAYLKAREDQVARFHLQKAVELGIDDEYKAAIMEIIK